LPKFKKNMAPIYACWGVIIGFSIAYLGAWEIAKYIGYATLVLAAFSLFQHYT
jgi:hypothetical protein